MAAADVLVRSQQERTSRTKPFTQWVRNLTNLKSKSGDQQEKTGGKAHGKKTGTLRGRKNGTLKNSPYPQSGALAPQPHSPSNSTNGASSVVTPTSQQPHQEDGSFRSFAAGREAFGTSNKSGAPTLATNAETVHSDAGHSKAATTTTQGGALSDGIGQNSTFSSPSHSQHSLTTTLTTIQSTSAGNALNSATGNNTTPHHHGSLNNPNPVMFSHQFPVSPSPSNANTVSASAIPRHMTEQPQTYDRATAGGLLTDNASILTLASSSKRRRPSYESQTDASVRALAPSSVWGGSRESLPLSVLSGNVERSESSGIFFGQSRPSISGLASTERASVYSNSGGVAAPALASERNSFYNHSHKQTKDLADAKSLRSITNIDARSQHGDAKSINTNADAKSTTGTMGGGGADAKSVADVASLKNYEGSVRSGALGGHSRQESGAGSVVASPTATSTGSPGGLLRNATSGGLSRRSSDWQDLEKEDVAANPATEEPMHGDGVAGNAELKS